MTALLTPILLIGASVSGCIAAAGFVMHRSWRLQRAQRHEAMLCDKTREEVIDHANHVSNPIILYGKRLTHQLYVGKTSPLGCAFGSKTISNSRSIQWFEKHCKAAGLYKIISPVAFRELRIRTALIGVAAGALIGLMLSELAAIMLAIVVGVVCWMLPVFAIKRATEQRANSAEKHLSEMLEIVALGMRSGLTFDRSFELYGRFFTNEFAQSCTHAYRSWSLGLCTREEALHELSVSYAVPQLSCVVDSIIRNLKFGTPFVGALQELSEQARASCKAELEERVAKAPVKMMLPTGTLILPAMLLLIIGPVLLELASDF